jgi:hypothetical protein
MSETVQILHGRPLTKRYLAVSVIIAASVALLVVVTGEPLVPADARELVRPMSAMFALTAAVWLLMGLYRNVAVMRGIASIRYYHDYKSNVPDEWIERPARTFNNLMQVPTLFYVIALLMMVTAQVDRVQIVLAWIFVGARMLHAAIYIGFNYVPFRFAMFTVSCMTLAVMWGRFALRF